MKCLRCGYCCKHYSVVIVDDPKKGPVEGNVIGRMGNGESCKHLQGDKIGEYGCSVHGEPWYEETPCFEFGQIEHNLNANCRMGEYILAHKEKLAKIPGE